MGDRGGLLVEERRAEIVVEALNALLRIMWDNPKWLPIDGLWPRGREQDGGGAVEGNSVHPRYDRSCVSRGETMYLTHLHVQNLKLVEDLCLDFTRPDGTPRMWTVLIGPNGAAKTSLLQAIALAAVGPTQISRLADGQEARLRSRLGDASLSIEARFVDSIKETPVEAKFTLDAGRRDFVVEGPSPAAPTHPLWDARVKVPEPPGWFAAAYGVNRNLPVVGDLPHLENPPFDRLASAFDNRVGLTSTNFVDYFDNSQRNRFLVQLKQVLIKVEGLLPDIDDLELRGRGGVKSGGELQERNRFSQRVGAESLKIPAISLSHGYQSTIAWISDLIGHLLLAHPKGKRFSAATARGLVLIDELDLHLHPAWQVGLIHALRAAFPKIQFVVATHSPLLLAALTPERDAIVDLTFDPNTGGVIRRAPQGDPRLMSGSQLYARYFHIEHTFVGDEGRLLQAYLALACNPFRSDEDDVRLGELQRELDEAEIPVGSPPVPRRTP